MTTPSVFWGVYGQDAGISKLNCTTLGLCIWEESQKSARIMDKIYKHLEAEHEGAGHSGSMLRMSLFCHWYHTPD